MRHQKFKFLSTLGIVAIELLPRSALAVDYTQENNRIEISAESCDELKTEAAFIDSWIPGDQTGRSRCGAAPTSIRDGKCVLNVTPCLPAVARTWFGKSAVVGKGNDEVEGPNCFNLALYTAGLSSALAFSNDSEMKLFLQAPLCKSVNSDEDPKPGDIGIITKQNDTIHGFTVVSPTTVWSKNGNGAGSSYLLQPYSFMKSQYEKMDGECVDCIGVKPGDEMFDRCGYCFAKPQYSFYRCETLNQYLSSSPDPIDTRLMARLLETDSLDCQASKMFFDNGALTQPLAKTLNESLLAVATFYNQETKEQPIAKPPKSPRDFTLALIKMRIQSLQSQVESLRSLAGEKDYTDLQPQVLSLLETDR